MRKSFTAFLALLLLPLLAMAQVVVPKNIYFADIHLKISDGAQAAIQKKVDALHRNQNYFKVKVDLADAYFPVIERVFKEEGVPDDYKYLALQESGLIGDAVSTSNAVGYWQFKREAALDFNLRMDRSVDERRHIVEASRGAAKYFKRSNGYYNNWLNSLLSYYLGYTGAKAYSKPSDNGAKNMDITERSNDYILTFLAHKVAYDNFVGKANPPAIALKELRANPGQSLSDIALATKTDYAELERYNKWLLGSSIPSDKDYYVMVPVRNGSGFDSGMLASAKADAPVRQNTSRGAATSLVKQNNLNAVVAREGDTKDKLALKAGIPTRRFLKYNDMHNFDKIVPGSTYYIEQKRASADTEFHVVQPGETMQLISQHYGVRLNYLLFKNRMKRNEMPVPGRVLWLQNRRPAHTPVEIRDLNKQQAATATTAKTQRTEPAAAAKEPVTPQTKNIFTRFIESLKGETKEEAQPQEEPMATTKTTPVATSKPAPVKQEVESVEEVAVKEVAVAPAEEAPVSPAPVAEKQTAVLYPDKTATAKASEGATKPKASATEPFPAPTAQTAPATANETFPADSTDSVFGQEPASEEESLFGEETFGEEEEAAVPFPATTAATPTPKATPATAAPAPAKPQTSKPTTHIVKQGETLYGISRMYAVTINDLTEWNKLGDAPLKLGQELLIAEPLMEPETKSVFRDEEDPEALPATLLSTNSAYHTVAAGETLYQLSKKYNVSLDQLRQWNSLTDNNLKLGQELRVKAPAAAASPAPAKEVAPAASSASGSVYHTVASGESMYQISRQYGVTIKDIMEWNKKPDFAVSVGEKLLIRKK